jgi:hypothetical protein
MDPSKPQYLFDEDGTFNIIHYNRAAPFASFLPGIAGPWGIPMWAFYVNRGQGMCSFGLRDKDHPISEFLSANWAAQLVFDHGFRTFIKVTSENNTPYEPFRVWGTGVQTMRISPDAVAFEERNAEAGFEVRVRYFTLTDEPLAALVRTMEIRNIAGHRRSLELLDGLPMVVPHGLDNFMLKNMRNLAPCFCAVSGLETKIPGLRAKTSTGDEALVEEIREMNFFFGFEQSGSRELLQPIVDARMVFGSAGYPAQAETFYSPAFHPAAEQRLENILPCGFVLAQCDLEPGQQRVFHSFYGHAPQERAIADFAARARSDEYVEARRKAARDVITLLSQPCRTLSSHTVLNTYALQNLLDNRLRGGAPVTIAKNKKQAIVLPLYSRKHGDLERDYNPYVIEPTYFSQGEGNYRDVNQNRRHDIFFNPDVGADNVVSFFNMIQPDGNNPLVVKPKKLVCRRTPALTKHLKQALGARYVEAVLAFVTQEFEIGRLFHHLAVHDISLKCSRQVFLDKLLEHAEPVQDSVHGVGYWTDHWTYNLDLLDTFRGIYPDQYTDLLFKQKKFLYCDTHVAVRPRSEKYMVVRDRPMQLHALHSDKAKEALLLSRTTLRHAVRTKKGRGAVYMSTLATKLLALAAVKLASLDPHGIGIEMDSERPNWYDALNGLPGQFGSSTCESFELKRLVMVLEESLDLAPENFKWTLPSEIADLVRGETKLLGSRIAGSPARRAFIIWDRISTLKETFRARTFAGFDGRETTLTRREVEAFVERAREHVEDGLRRARDSKTGLYRTYYRQEVTSFAKGKVGPEGFPTCTPKAFKAIPLPLFLEGQVHAMRVAGDERSARAIYQAVRQSSLYDNALKMYKVNASLEDEPLSIGRTRTFARGWLENESVWVHMEYKYLLEILRAGLAEEFFDEFRRCGIPFLSPETYGRSPTENSSFIASSAYVNPSDIGRGFMARLSGATAEFIHMWVLMTSGERPFRVDNRGRLEAVLQPTLPAWLFTDKPGRFELLREDGSVRSYEAPAGSFGFVFLGRTAVLYRQEGAMRPTYGEHAAKVTSYELTYDDGRTVRIEGNAIPLPHAAALRNREIDLVRITLG